MNRCTTCDTRTADFVLYPHFAAYNASGQDRPRQPLCGICAADLLAAKQVERVSPFAFVRIPSRVAEQR